MLKKMRQRFIISAMSAIAAVMTVLVLGINCWNYFVTINRMNQTIAGLMEAEHMRVPPEGMKRRRPGDFFDRPSPEDPYMLRYFSVHINADENITSIGRDFISSISEEEAIAYASLVLEKGKQMGFYKEYRYVAERNSTGTDLFFLNVSKELQFMKILLFISCFVAFVSIVLVFLLVLVFSKRAIRPYVENIERQKRFITDASHEIKTPLTSIAASAEVLAMENGENEWVANIKSQTKRLSKLTADLVTLSRLDEERPFFEKSDFSFSEAVWEIIESVLPLFQAKSKVFQYQIEEDLTFCGDRASIQQMISILLYNALKYSDEKGQVRLDVCKKHKSIILEVFNTCDIKDTADIDRLFDRFYRPDASRSSEAGGYGIGLSIAKAIAEAHNGKISVKCRSGKSICFQIKL